MIKKIPPETECYHFYNENPKNKRSGDCVFRAISLATEIDWDTVLDNLVSYAHKYKQSPNEKRCYEKYLKDNGWVKMSQPRKDDGTKYTGKEFCRLLKKTGASRRIVAHIGAHHLIAVIDYKIWDIWDSSDGCVGNYWVKQD